VTTTLDKPDHSQARALWNTFDMDASEVAQEIMHPPLPGNPRGQRITAHNAMDLLMLADRYKMPAVKSECRPCQGDIFADTGCS
jgi:hypothetical protein